MRLRDLFGVRGRCVVSELHVKVVRDRWNGELIVLHRGADAVVALLTTIEWDRLVTELAAEREDVSRPPRKR